MASQKNKKKFKRFAGTAATVQQSNIFPKGEKNAAPAARHEPPVKIAIQLATATPVINPASKQTENKTAGLPVIKKTTPLSSPSRHAWAPPQLPFARDIPSHYNETYLRMIPRGPHHIYSFWEIGGEDLEKVKGITEGSAGEDKTQPVLRLYTVGSKQGKKAGVRMHRIGDIAVPPGVNSHYVRVPESGRTYRMELGIMTSSGRFVAFCQSNETATPRARVQIASKGETSAQQGCPRSQTQKLIDFSLLSGKMIAEADQCQPLLFADEDEPLAMEAGSDFPSWSGRGSTVSSWSGCTPAILPEESAQ